jgi:putative membrane protein
MRIRRDFGLLLAGSGFFILGAWGELAAQTPGQNPSQGQQPATQSPYPSANDPLPGGSTNAKTAMSGDTMGEAQSRQMDKRFLHQISQGSMLNVEMAKLAQQKATTETVKQFSEKMLEDHKRGIEIVKKIAVRDGVTLPDALDSKHKEQFDKLAKLSGPEFDRAYVKEQLKLHQRLVTYFQNEADNGTDTAAKKMATNMLPAVQQHLDMVKDLNRTLNATAMK